MRRKSDAPADQLKQQGVPGADASQWQWRPQIRHSDFANVVVKRLAPADDGLARRLGWRSATVLACAILSVAGIGTAQARNVALLQDASVTTYFSPNGGAVQARVDLIDAAKTRVLMAGYGFTSDAIAQALIAAHQRGVKVQVVIDKSNVHSRYSKGMQLRDAGVDVRSHHAYAIMHHKFVVVDEKVAFGSMNATDSGETRNAENWNVFSNAGPLARIYATEFERLHASGRVFESEWKKPKRDDAAAETIGLPKDVPITGKGIDLQSCCWPTCFGRA
ncbi:phospholipase D family nuclease [Robbsia andropogonis]|uniref:phospholipase D family nuclease n=1 Tax=Robbsia andropogonis TaxID=28092 RepID=UPI0004659918|nr:phospholipase D family protein [Robbsia andropogonis]MCP1120897.1 phospholipase D family protein [Robbsia andropogonis]MCP1130729.1 phospholipase D family protein [Robbsia andropogonis]